MNDMAAPPTGDSDAEPAVPPPPSTRRLRVVQVLTVVVIIGALGAALYFRDRLQELEQYSYAAVFVVGLIGDATVVLPLPGLAFIFVMGGIFNPWIVGIAGGVGQALGELTGYMAGYSGQTLVDESPIYDRLTQWMQRYGALTIFVLSIVPNPLFDVGGVIAGALRFPVWKFLTSCVTGKVIKSIVFAMAGYYGVEAIFRLLG
ncbi:MAG: VTT domain-containing protein [Chloroflexi bacterium]|nr:VTT domain-containing protein [Chloroflexota bacterium]